MKTTEKAGRMGVRPASEKNSEQMTLYQENKKRSVLDWLILGVVVLIAGVVIALSFSNTAKLAEELGLSPLLTAGLVEILFASLLFIRGRQRATQRNVPLFLSVGYFVSLSFVTAVNMYGLYQENPVVGPIVGGAISGAMWLMESVLVWLWVDSHKPHEKSLREIQREAKKEIKKMKLLQRVEWMKWEAQKPDLALIREARKAEQKREQIVRDGLPEFFGGTSEKIEEPQKSHEKPHEEFVDASKTSEKIETSHETPQKSSKKFEETDEENEEPQETLTPDEAAVRIYEETGNLPKIREIEELAGCKEWPARQARTKLKEQIEEQKTKVLQLKID